MTFGAKGNWGDLVPRVFSALVMVLVGGGAIYFGGPWFRALAALITGLMVWELMRMAYPAREAAASLFGLLATFVQLIVIGNNGGTLFALFGVLAIAAGAASARDRIVVAVYCLGLLFAPWGLVYFRETAGLPLIAWVVAVVVVTDIMGYFAGRFLGGPKFWPRVSPKKTWSGTIAGWVGAAVVGLIYVWATDAPMVYVIFSVAISFAGQMGDIAESAIKRRAGIKDSSNLIPGHGGLLDRFDALVAASVLLLVLHALFGGAA